MCAISVLVSTYIIEMRSQPADGSLSGRDEKVFTDEPEGKHPHRGSRLIHPPGDHSPTDELGILAFA